MFRWCALFAWTLPLLAQGEPWSLEAYVGDAYNFRTRLKVEQDGGFSRSMSADYDTRGFDRPLYYLLRAARWQEARAWEASLIHHKLYLTNPPAGVTALSISHGFNILAVGGGRRLYLGSSAFLSVELIATAAYASAKLRGPPDARIRATNAAIHALAGMGYEFR